MDGRGMKIGGLGVAVAAMLMACATLTSSAEAFGPRGGGAPMGPRAFNQGFRGGPPFPGSSFNTNGYNGSFPGFDGPCRGGAGCLSGFNRFNQGFKNGFVNNGFNGGAGLGWWYPWGGSTVYYPGYYAAMSPNYAPPTYPVTYYAPQFYAPTYPPPAAYSAPAGGSISIAPTPPAPAVV